MLARITLAQVAGHAWNGKNGDETRRLLSYEEARRKIYLPAFHWVNENVEAVRTEVTNLARAATQARLVAGCAVPALHGHACKPRLRLLRQKAGHVMRFTPTGCLPLFTSVLVAQKRIVLLDYFTNDQVANLTQPLSHGGLLRKYIQRNWRRLLGLAEPEAPAAAAEPEG